jgi:hypothetical protein
VLGDGELDLVFLLGWPSHLGLLWENPSLAGFLHKLVSRQATFALFDACAIKGGWVMVRQRAQGEAPAHVEDARRGDGEPCPMA